MEVSEPRLSPPPSLVSSQTTHEGAGNNWGQGYEMCSGDFLASAMDGVRREVELSDSCPYILTCHSLAGGTGSGLGSKVSEQMRES
jgi:hypothetical protein